MHDVRKIAQLQVLRAIAASAVVAAHAIEYPVRRGYLEEKHYQLAWCLGWIGVATFFVISGLIMFRSAGDMFGSTEHALNFIKRRLIRVAPLYWIMTVPFVAAKLARGEVVTFEMLLKSFLFVPYYSVSERAMRPIVGQGWTLNFEMFFYIVFAFCLIWPRRVGLPILLLFFPAIVFIRTFFWPIFPYDDAASVFQFWTDPISLLFLLGVCIGMTEAWIQLRFYLKYSVLLSSLLLATIVCSFLLMEGNFPLQIGWQALFGLSGGAAVFLCTCSRERSEYTSNGIERALVVAGDASYSTYLIHPLVLMVLAAAWDRLTGHTGQAPAVFVIASIIISNIIGYINYRAIERPLTHMLHARLASRPPSASGSSRV